MKRKIFTFALIMLLAIPSGLLLSACSGSSTPKEVLRFETDATQTTGAVTFRNYKCVLKADTNWYGLSSSKQTAIINYAFRAAREHANENGISNFNIVCMTEGTDDKPAVMIFMYDREHDQVVIFKDGERYQTMPAPKAE